MSIFSSKTNDMTLFQSAFPQRDKGSAIALMTLSFVTGLVVLWKANSYRISLQTAQTYAGACSTTSLWLARILMVLGIIMILAPVVVLGVSLSGNFGRFNSIRALEEQYKAQVIALVFGVLVLVLLIWLNMEMKKCDQSVDTLTWAVVIINLVGCLGLLGFRYVSDKNAIEAAQIQADEAGQSYLSRGRNYVSSFFGNRPLFTSRPTSAQVAQAAAAKSAAEIRAGEQLKRQFESEAAARYARLAAKLPPIG